MNQGPPSLAALASAGRPLPTRIINGYNTSAAIGVDINRVYEIGSGLIREDVIDERPLTAVTVLHELAEVRAVPVTVAKQTLWVRTDITGHVAELFRAIGARIPPRLIKSTNVVAQTSPEPACA